MGKGREIASLVLDNLQQGRRRAVWCSISTVLPYDLTLALRPNPSPTPDPTPKPLPLSPYP